MSSESKAIAGVVTLILVVVAVALFGTPAYNVWSAGMSGKAKLRRAEQEKRIMIEQAKAEVEAAKLRSEAIKAVGEAAQQYPEYRAQEFIAAFGDAMSSDKIEQIIYVPTEAGLPIVEAGRVGSQ